MENDALEIIELVRCAFGNELIMEAQHNGKASDVKIFRGVAHKGGADTLDTVVRDNNPCRSPNRVPVSRTAVYYIINRNCVGGRFPLETSRETGDSRQR